MLTGLRGRAIHAIALGALVASAVAPSALVLYRCRMMGTTMSSPCCGEDEEQASQAAQLDSERCCVRVSVALERSPSDLTQKAGPAPALALAAPLPAALAAPTTAPLLARWTRAQFDAGPPILRRVCSLLI